MARNKQQEDFSRELERRSNNIFPVGGTYHNDYADATVSIYKGNLNYALTVIAGVTENPSKFDKSAVHIWSVREGLEPSWAFKLPPGTQLRELTPNDLYCNESAVYESEGND